MSTSERGSAAVELAIIGPALVGLLLLVAVAGRITTADAVVRRAAADAARTGSLRATPSSAAAAATAAVATNLAGSQLRCVALSTVVDTDDFGPGGRLTVTVECTVDLSDVALLAMPGQRTLRAAAVEVVDRYRGEP